MYSHTENTVVVTQTDASNPPKPVAWAITGTRDLDQRGYRLSERQYDKPIPCYRDGTRIVAH